MDNEVEIVVVDFQLGALVHIGEIGDDQRMEPKLCAQLCEGGAVVDVVNVNPRYPLRFAGFRAFLYGSAPHFLDVGFRVVSERDALLLPSCGSIRVLRL